MNINPISLQNFKISNPFNVVQNPFNRQSGINGSNLAPLEKDTISFSGSAKLTGENMVYAPTSRNCRQVHDNAGPAALYLEKVLKNYLDPINENAPADEPLITVSTRTKSPTSIREKVVSKYGKIARDEKEQFCQAAVNELFRYFTPKQGFTKEMAVIESNIILDFLTPTRKIPPSGNEGYLLQEISKELEKRQFIKFRSDSPVDRNNAFSEMENRLKDITNDEHCEKNGMYIDPTTMDGIKHYANDIVGARIILNDSSVRTTQKVVDALKAAAKDGMLTISSVENNVPDPKKLPQDSRLADYEYLPEPRLRALATVSDANYEKIHSKSGYLAIHVNIDLSNNKFASKKNEFNGFQGEIQIMDSCIEEFKDIEDLCYKFKDEKNAFRTKYKAFRDHFKKYYSPQRPKLMKAFDSYTYDMYLAQRRKSIEKKQSDMKFPTREELGYEKTVPSGLDYNYLFGIKAMCDLKNKDSSSGSIFNNPDTQNAHSYDAEGMKRLNKLLFDLGLGK